MRTQEMFGHHRQGKVLGLHLRGTDILDTNSKYTYRKRIPVQHYMLAVDAYLQRYPSALIFVATDDSEQTTTSTLHRACACATCSAVP